MIRAPKSQVQIVTDETPTTEYERFFGEVAAFLTPVVQNVNPGSGDIIRMADNERNGFLRIQGSGPLGALTINFPAGVDGQQRTIVFDVAVTALTWGSTGALPASAAAGDSVTAIRLEAGKWNAVN